MQRILYFLFLLIVVSCNAPQEEENTNTPKSSDQKQRFQLLNPDQTGISFQNQIKETYEINILNYEYLYNGAGVSVGDLNNDGLPEIYFVSNQFANKLYLNKGNMQFEDITDKAGLAVEEGFKTGVTMADVNADGLLDIYVCRTNKDSEGLKDNILFINNGDLTFTDKTAEYNLLDNSNTNHANFFDYDLDGDLDLYLLNHKTGFKQATNMRLKQDEQGKITRILEPETPYESDRLYRNDNGKFVNVSESAGIVNSTFGLSATVSDINMDGYPDIFVANDYIEPDNVYINNGDGTFTDKYFEYFRHSSQNSMGADIADFNNDALPDIVVLDMASNDHVRYKTLMTSLRTDRYNTLLKYGYGHQIERNMLQVNNGDGTFSEIAQLAGISNTDWSWGALFYDMDNDGLKDLFIGNGYRRDLTDLDYVTYVRDSIEKTGGVNNQRFPSVYDFLEILPSTKLRNYAYLNQGNLMFEDVTDAWGMDQKGFSNGAAYGDFDGDGDLDLVTNNIDEAAYLYENLTDQIDTKNYLQIKLEGLGENTYGLGTKVTIHQGDGLQFKELSLTRGFLSSSQPILHFGLGNNQTVDLIEVEWPDKNYQTFENVSANQLMTITYEKTGKTAPKKQLMENELFEEVTDKIGVDFRHVENNFSDFDREKLLPRMYSNSGPFLAVADVNGDELDDFYIGGAAQSPGALYIQNANATFSKASSETWEADKAYEDLESVFLDADGDQDMDLYVVSGGSQPLVNSEKYTDRLYLNDGQGNFSRAENFPANNSSGACALAYDYDGDGDKDLFVGGRVSPGVYPRIPDSYLFKNNNGSYEDVSDSEGALIREVGMVTDIKVGDLDGDQQEEILVTGEWLPIMVMSYQDGQLVDRTEEFGFSKTNGWWNCMTVEDFDNDGDLDIMAGNLGLNSRLEASPESPLYLFGKDFDRNGQIDPIMAYAIDGKIYPYAQRDNLASQIPKIKKKFTRYRPYAKSTVEEVFSPEALEDAMKFEAYCLESSYFENDNGTFKRTALPPFAQVAPVFEILSGDFNDDGKKDALLVGNFDGSETETGRFDASNGVLLLNEGNGNWSTQPNRKHGFWAAGETRDIAPLTLANGRELILVAKNNDQLKAYALKRNSKVQ